MQTKKVSIFLVPFLFVFVFSASAQNKTLIDGVVAVVGNKIVMNSDVESRYLQYQAQGYKATGNMKCEIMEDILFQKLLVNQAQIDSIEVSSAEVESNLDSRLQGFIDQIGSVEELETYFNKSLPEIKAEFRDVVREQLITQRMQGEINGAVTVSPANVKRFYNQIPKNEIPLIEEQYEVAQIVIHPTIPTNEHDRVVSKLTEIREKIINGTSFTAMAVLHSEGPSSTTGGELGFTTRASLDPAYASAAVALEKGETSHVVESSFGYHIIQLVDRKGDQINTRHILMRPKVTIQQKQTAKILLDSIANLIRIDSISFERAALVYSNNEDTRVNGGLIVNPYTGTSKFVLNELPPEVKRTADGLKIGEISEPFEAQDRAVGAVYQIILLKSKTKPHKANLRDDYYLLKQEALAKKQDDSVREWVKEKQKSSYVRIDDTFRKCEYQFKGWLK